MPKDKKISLEEVEHIAELARIELTEKEKRKFSDELSDVLGYVEQLQRVNTKNIEQVLEAGCAFVNCIPVFFPIWLVAINL